MFFPKLILRFFVNRAPGVMRETYVFVRFVYNANYHVCSEVHTV